VGLHRRILIGGESLCSAVHAATDSRGCDSHGILDLPPDPIMFGSDHLRITILSGGAPDSCCTYPGYSSNPYLGTWRVVSLCKLCSAFLVKGEHAGENMLGRDHTGGGPYCGEPS